MFYANDPVHWRNRAYSLRRIADETNDVRAKTIILELANEHDNRANQLEARDRAADVG